MEIYFFLALGREVKNMLSDSTSSNVSLMISRPEIYEGTLWYAMSLFTDLDISMAINFDRNVFKLSCDSII